MKYYLQNCANLVAMVERMREQYWADWDEVSFYSKIQNYDICG